MNKVNVKVPSGIRYISEWAMNLGGDCFSLPNGHIIINKILPGCGFTQYCLDRNVNSTPVILCSPRVVLLENKLAQTPRCFYVQGGSGFSTGEENRIKKKNNFTDKQLKDYFDNCFKDKLYNYLVECINYSSSPKILVTYDSLKKLFSSLEDIFNNSQLIFKGMNFNSFSVVVDEFHLIFNDANFKSRVELNFLSYLQNFPNVCYVSATPVLDNYLDEMDEFKDLPYYELDWGDRAFSPTLYKHKTDNPDQVIRNIISTYKRGDFKEKLVEIKDDLGNIIEQKIVQSKEVVFYVNSVRSITSAIKLCSLSPDEVNIICSNSVSDNKTKIKSCGKQFNIGTVPLKGESHKMFTFCTSTAYCGVDFYSTNARTVIISDGDVNSMAVDISLDLPQILGRQRLDCNPWKFEAEFYYKTAYDGMTTEEFEQHVDRKLKDTYNGINIFNKLDDLEKVYLLNKYDKVIHGMHYTDDYLGIQEKSPTERVPVLNKLVLLAERRAYELQNLIYKSIFYVNSACNNYGFKSVNDQYQELYLELMSMSQYEDRLKYCCNYIEKHPEDSQFLAEIPLEYSEPISKLGTDFIKSVGYIKSNVIEKLKYENSLKSIQELILKEFQIGQRYLVTDIKEKLRKIYDSFEIKWKKPLATDLSDIFNISPIKILVDNNKRLNGYKIISLK